MKDHQIQVRYCRNGPNGVVYHGNYPIEEAHEKRTKTPTTFSYTR
jgi:acyl-CoA thioesterase FadM